MVAVAVFLCDWEGWFLPGFRSRCVWWFSAWSTAATVAMVAVFLTGSSSEEAHLAFPGDQLRQAQTEWVALLVLWVLVDLLTLCTDGFDDRRRQRDAQVALHRGRYPVCACVEAGQCCCCCCCCCSKP